MFVNASDFKHKVRPLNSSIENIIPLPDMSGESFHLNYGGNPRSDIAYLNGLEDIAVAETLLNKMAQLPDSGNTNADLTDEQLLAMCGSAKAQTFADMVAKIERGVEEKYRAEIASVDAERVKAEYESRKSKIQSLKDSLSAEERDSLNKKRRQIDIEKLIDND